ncbi:MAG TPA: xanthine dehydrogenase family protein subunit M [Acidimicrobiales bacterium]|nr:xanthine dehydrogenase family protein subunit M [Acidimicrobiales bacterium]HUZ42361.1 xanthine dehydrogenase family protein subunit M [Acidimicrobiales bacterium]
MIPASFDYVRAGSVDEAIGLLSEHGDDAKLLAGGHSLLPLMKLRLAQPAMLVDIGRLNELSYVKEENGYVAVGALTRHHDIAVSPVALASAPVLAHVAGQIGDPQVRHRGTIGGSISHGDPASDLPAVLLALGGTLVVQGPNGRREIDAKDFFRSFFEVALTPEEVVVEVRVPRSDGRWGFEKLTKRAQDWAIVGAVAARTGNGVGVGLINMGPVPLRASAVESAVASGANATEAAQFAAEGTEPPADINGSVAYRQHVAKVLVRRALEKAGV